MEVDCYLKYWVNYGSEEISRKTLSDIYSNEELSQR